MTEEKCAECGLAIEGTSFELPDGRRICAACLYERPTYGRSPAAEFLRQSVKQTIACPFCGGIDAHLPNCRGGYGL